jgi:hypothetical protein
MTTIGSADIPFDAECDIGIAPMAQEASTAFDGEEVGRVALRTFSAVAALAGTAAACARRRRKVITQEFAPAGFTFGPTASTEEDAPPEPFPTCTEEEKKTAQYIFKMLATATKVELTRKTSELRAKGEEIKHIHTFAFLLALPREHMRSIFSLSQQSFSYVNVNLNANIVAAGLQVKEFLQGIDTGMKRALEEGSVEQHIPELAKRMGNKDPETISRLIQAVEWRKLVFYLFDIDLPQEE